MLELAFAILPARGPNHAGGPIYYLAGGPGQSARSLLPIQRFLLRDLHRHHDLIFLDQRGTGDSHPLDCDFSQLDPFADLSQQTIADAYAECLEQLDADVRHYGTREAARDLEALRAHLNHDQINLLGTSYGTRVAQVYLRHYPERVRSMILDGVVPMELPLGSEHGRMLDQALSRIAQRCATTPACAEHYPTMTADLDELRTRLQQSGGIEVEVPHPRTGKPVPFSMRRETLAQTIRMLSYAAHTQALLPLLLSEARDRDDFSRLASQFLIIQDQVDELVSTGMEASVSCSEDWPRWAQLLPDEADTLLGDRMRLQRGAICSVWPANPVVPEFHQPVAADVPTLLLSGELDPVTPPEYAEITARHLETSRHLVVSGQGHGVLSPPCMTAIAANFVATLAPEALDTECLNQQTGLPFFESLLGPGP